MLCEKVYAQAPLTFPSHASIFTGTNPTIHGIRDNIFQKMPSTLPTLATILKMNGYRNIAVVSAATVARETGLSRGFHEYDDIFADSPDSARFIPERIAAKSIAIAIQKLQSLARNRRRRFFLWVHLFDPHAEYNPPSPFKEKFKNPYDGEIAYTDNCLGELFSKLKALDLEDETLVVLMADHGEGLEEHGEPSHGYFLYNSTLHVPLIFKAPKLIPAGERIKTPVRSIDVMPTVLSLLGIKHHGKAQGRNLAKMISNPENHNYEDEILPVYTETFYPYNAFGWRPLRSLIIDDLKYIDTQEGELYDLRQDSKEKKNLLMPPYPSPENKTRAAELKTELENLYHQSAITSSDQDTSSTPSESRKQALLSLGYAESASFGYDLESALQGACPAQMAPLIKKIIKAQTMLWYQQKSEAKKLLLEILEQDPCNITALKLLGKIYSEQQNLPPALENFQKLFQLRPDFPLARNAVVDILIRMGKFKEARTIIKNLKPEKRDAFIFSRLAFLELRDQNYRQAIQAADKATKLDPDLPSAWGYLAEGLELCQEFTLAGKAYYKYSLCLKRRRQYKEMLPALKKALHLVGNQPMLRQDIEQLLREVEKQ